MIEARRRGGSLRRMINAAKPGSVMLAKGRALALLAVVLFLASCGFHPMYGEFAGSGINRTAQMGQVDIASIPDRNGQILRNHLIDRMYQKGRPDRPLYRLSVSIVATEQDLGIQKDSSATRAELILRANCVLNDINTGKEMSRWESRSFVRYDIMEAQYATLAAKDNAYERGLEDLADDVVTHLALSFGQDDLNKKSR